MTITNLLRITAFTQVWDRHYNACGILQATVIPSWPVESLCFKPESSDSWWYCASGESHYFTDKHEDITKDMVTSSWLFFRNTISSFSPLIVSSRSFLVSSSSPITTRMLDMSASAATRLLSSSSYLQQDIRQYITLENRLNKHHIIQFIIHI